MHENILLSRIGKFFDCLYRPDLIEKFSISEIRDAFRPSQLQSKQWLFEQLVPLLKPSDNIAVLGSWFGFVASCLNEMKYKNITDIDIDARLHDFSIAMNSSNEHYRRLTCDATVCDLSTFNIVINTSTEHMNNNWFNAVANNAIVAIQTNNIKIESHVNTCDSLLQVTNNYPMKILYQGQLEFKTYTRFQLIGIKI